MPNYMEIDKAKESHAPTVAITDRLIERLPLNMVRFVRELPKTSRERLRQAMGGRLRFNRFNGPKPLIFGDKAESK